MRMKSVALLLAAAGLAAGALRAQDDQPSRRGRRRGRAPEAPQPADAQAATPSSAGGSTGADKQALEIYLKQRLGQLEQAHQARMDFMGRESAAWQEFWQKVKEDRRRFEISVARQRLDFFESMSSIDPQAYGTTIADFEKMQANVLKTFELQQKQRMEEFFTRRDVRWKEFALQQEKERGDFVAQADAAWQTQKADLRGGSSSAVKADKR